MTVSTASSTSAPGALPNQLTATEAKRRLVAGELTSVELVTSCLERIAIREADVKAWAHVDADRALEQARQADRTGHGLPGNGCLHGIPVGIKDIIDTADMPTLLGEPEIYAGRQPDTDAAMVAELRKSGAIILGKTAGSKHTIMLPGPTRNPHDLSRTPGASSSGSAAAVGDFMIPLAVSTQTAGSILRPATYCGVVGYKPTKDTVEWTGSRVYSPELDTAGAMGRCVADTALLVQALSGRADFTMASAREDNISVGLYRTPYFDKAEDYVRQHYENSVETLRAAGVTILDVEVPQEFDQLSELQDIVMAYDLNKVFADHHKHHFDLLDPELVAYCAMGAEVTDQQYAAALVYAARCRELLPTAFRDVDALLIPSTLTDAPPMASTGTSEFIRIWSFLHTPAINLPTGLSPAHMPISIQLVGNLGDDVRFLATAERIDQILSRP